MDVDPGDKNCRVAQNSQDGAVHPSGFEDARENTGENVIFGAGGNAGGNEATDRHEIATQMQAAWDRLDDPARADLLAIAKGLLKQQAVIPKKR